MTVLIEDTETSVDVAFTGFKSFLKLLVIVTSYSSAFITLIQFGFWTFEVRPISCDVWTWYNDYCNGLWSPRRVAELLLFDLGLIVLFIIQHSLMSKSRLMMTKYWDFVHFRWEIDKAIYNIATAFALQILIGLWQPVGVSLWEISYINNPPYVFHFVVHILAWGIFYGTNLMVDLPELIGLNQTAPQFSHTVMKSPDLKAMMENQRHMGMLPLFTVLLFHPLVSFDRLLLAVGILTYTYCSWKSQSCYPYAKSMRRMKRLCEDDHED